MKHITRTITTKEVTIKLKYQNGEETIHCYRADKDDLRAIRRHIDKEFPDIIGYAILGVDTKTARYTMPEDVFIMNATKIEDMTEEEN